MDKNKTHILSRIISIICVAAVILIGTAFLPGCSTASKTSTTSEPSATTAPSTVNYSDIISSFDYGEDVTYVIGHKSPDTDTVMSAIAMANLLNKLGVKAEARMAGKPNGETAYVFEKYNITQPAILDDATDKQLWLVDHSEYAQTVTGAEDARIVGIIDHHGIGDVSNSEQIFVNSANVGSAATLVWKLYKDFNIEIDLETAQVLLCGFMSDTSYVTAELTAMDEAAFADLLEITGITDYASICAEMKEAKIAYKGMSDTDIFYNDYKEYNASGYTYCIGNISVKSEDLVDAMADRMEEVIKTENANSEIDFYIAMVYNTDHTYGRSVFVGKDEDLIKALTDTVLIDAEQYAGTEDNTVIFKPSVSRKAVVVPRINEYLKNLTEAEFTE